MTVVTRRQAKVAESEKMDAGTTTTTTAGKKSSQSVKRKDFQWPDLPEIKLCWAVSLGAIAYSMYLVYEASAGYTWKAGDMVTENELPLIGKRFKDESNWEWSQWQPYMLQFLPVFLAHALLFNVVQPLLPERVFQLLYTALSMGACAYHFSGRLTLISIAQGVVIFTAKSLLGSSIVTWLSSLPILYYTMHNADALHDDPFLVLLYSSYTLLSYISFNLESFARPEDDTALKRLSRMFYYAFYIPYLVSLIVLYPDFERQLAERSKKTRNWGQIAFAFLRMAFWFGFVELVLHYFYFESIFRDLPYVYAITKPQLAALGQVLGAFFHWKYVVIFGVPSTFAALDKMQPLAGPVCIFRVVLYSWMWRAFDRGLYQFFKRYIFVPICAPTFSLPRKVIGVFVSYGFVLVWHGFYPHNIVWIGLNIAGLFLEMTAKAIYSIDSVRAWRERTISDVAFRRIVGGAQVVPFAFGLYSNFFFLGGWDVGVAYVRRILVEDTITLRPFVLCLLGLGYFHAQVSIEVERKLNNQAKASLPAEGKKSN